jgi:hypothetical protein
VIADWARNHEFAQHAIVQMSSNDIVELVLNSTMNGNWTLLENYDFESLYNNNLSASTKQYAISMHFLHYVSSSLSIKMKNRLRQIGILKKIYDQYIKKCPVPHICIKLFKIKLDTFADNKLNETKKDKEIMKAITEIIELVISELHAYAKCIQRNWHSAISNPKYKICNDRLVREINDLIT